MIKIHALDGYKYLRDPYNSMNGFNRRNLTYICLEMTDFHEDMKAFIFLYTHHSFHYEEIAIELKKLVNNKGQLPKTHIVYREEPLKGGQQGMTEDTLLVSKKPPYGILEYINMEKERYRKAEEDEKNERLERARWQEERDAKNQARKDKKALNSTKIEKPKKVLPPVTKEILNDYLNNDAFFAFVKNNKDNIRYNDRVLYINSETITKEFMDLNNNFNKIQQGKLIPMYMNEYTYLNEYHFRYWESIVWNKDKGIGHVTLYETRARETPENIKLGLIYDWIETYIDSDLDFNLV
jgi:hypothetical protein